MSALDDAVNAAIEAKLSPALVNQATINASVNSRLQALEQPTPPPPPSVTYGPRYDFIGGTRFPTRPGAYVVVDSTVPTDGTECSSQLAAFLNNKTKVPDGSNVVFDKTLGGAGTTYKINNSILLRHSGSLRSNITLWGYNSKIRQTQTSGQYATKFLWFDGGGWRDLSILGFDFDGPNTAAGTWNCRTIGSESGHAIDITAYDGLTIQDCYAHSLLGEFVNLTQWESKSSFHWPGGPDPEDADISYNLVNGTGRQGICVNQGTRVAVHHNDIRNVALSAFDSEDHYSPRGKLLDVSYHHNRIENWNWHLRPGNYFIDTAILFEYRNGDLPLGISGLHYDDNVFIGGPMGYGNPSAETTVLGSNVSGGYGPTLWFKLNVDGQPSASKSGVTIDRNDLSQLPAWYMHNKPVDFDPSDNGNAIVIGDVAGLSIQGNGLGARGIAVRRSTGITESGNTRGTFDLQ